MSRKPTLYESQEISAIKAWMNEKPSWVSEVASTIFAPASWVMKKILPEKAIEGAIIQCFKLAQLTADFEDICKDGCVDRISDLRNGKLERCDKLANSIHNWATSVALVEAGLTGTIGLYGAVIDIPALITIALRSIIKIGLCYGYEPNDETEKIYDIQILTMAGSATQKEKIEYTLTMRRLLVASRVSWKNMSKNVIYEALLLAAKDAAKKLGIRLTKSMVQKGIPIISIAVGALINTAFLNDVCWAARRSFQKRWLEENGVNVDIK